MDVKLNSVYSVFNGRKYIIDTAYNQMEAERDKYRELYLNLLKGDNKMITDDIVEKRLQKLLDSNLPPKELGSKIMDVILSTPENQRLLVQARKMFSSGEVMNLLYELTYAVEELKDYYITFCANDHGLSLDEAYDLSEVKMWNYLIERAKHVTKDETA